MTPSKRCGLCKEHIPLDQFGLVKGKLRSTCKKCRKLENQNKTKKKLWYQNNKDHCAKKNREYQDKNYEKIAAYKAEWVKKNKDKLAKKNKERYKENCHIQAWRRLLRRTLKGKKKTDKTAILMGYTSDELRLHLESLWSEDMSWDNYGEWHIDHIIPLHVFPTKTPISIINSLANLRPLWATTREINGIVYEGNLNRNRDKKKEQLVSLEDRPMTIIADIDGCLVSHKGNQSNQITEELELLPGVKGKFAEWDVRGYTIILTTGRRESSRVITENQLRNLGLYWDQLVMGVSSGRRVLINDLKPNSQEPTAVAINVTRNAGLTNLDIDLATKLHQLSMIYGVKLEVKQ